jgi:hypothetical protein
VRRPIENGVPKTASEEDRMRRRKAMKEAAKVRKIYEELVLKRPPEQLVQISNAPLQAGEQAPSAGRNPAQRDGSPLAEPEVPAAEASGD